VGVRPGVERADVFDMGRTVKNSSDGALIDTFHEFFRRLLALGITINQIVLMD
jgi:hypothetical protein